MKCVSFAPPEQAFRVLETEGSIILFNGGLVVVVVGNVVVVVVLSSTQSNTFLTPPLVF